MGVERGKRERRRLRICKGFSRTEYSVRVGVK